MLYLAHAQQPTSVTHALKCDLLESGVDCLVVCKHSRIEVHTLEPTGLKLVIELPIFGAVEAIQSVKPKGASVSTLLVLTASFQFFSLVLSPSSTSDRPTLQTTSSCSLKRPSARIAQFSITIAVDPWSRCVVVHVWDGEVWVVPIRTKTVDVAKGFDLKLPVISVRSFEALSLPDSVGPTVAYVYSDHTGSRFLRVQTINLAKKAFDDDPDLKIGAGSSGGPSRRSNDAKLLSIACPDETAERIIPVAGPSRSADSEPAGEDDLQGEAGLIVLGEESATFVTIGSPSNDDTPEATSPGKGKAKATPARIRRSSASTSGGPNASSPIWRRSCALPVNEIKCWTRVGSEPDAFLIGDVLGKLFILRLRRNALGKVEGLSAKELGDVSAPEALVYLEAGFVFVASHFGDSQLVTVRSPLADPEPDSMDVDGSGDLDLVATWTNLAPIVDFCVVDEPALGQSYLVTCSGAHQDGSLRLVRHGVGLKDLGSLDFANVQRVWAIRTADASGEAQHDALVLSQVDSTRFLAFSADGIEEVPSLKGFTTGAPTLAAGNVGPTAVQVTADSIIALGGSTWNPPAANKITVAEVGGDAVVIAMEGGDVRKFQPNAGEIKQTASAKLAYDVACLDVNTSLSLVAAGQWTANNVAVLSLANLSTLATIPTETTYHIRSVLFATFAPSSPPYLFIGLGDGTLLSSAIDPTTGAPREGTRKTVALGTRPITMTPFTATGGVPSVLINSDRPTIVTHAHDRLQYASVNIAGVVAATSFDADDFRQSLVLALPDGMRIARIDELQRMHVDTLPLEGEQPRRIAHSAALRAFGVICFREDVDRQTGYETSRGSFKIIDDATFAVLHDFAFEDYEQGQSVIAAELMDGEEHFIVGTAVCEPKVTEPEHGRLLAFRYAGEKEYELAHSVDVGGSAYSIARLPDGRLACCANAFVHVYEPSPERHSFKKLSSWGGAFISVRVISQGKTVLVADAFRSIVMLEYDAKLGTLAEEARDYNAHGTRSIAALDDEEFIGTDTDDNVFTVGRSALGGAGNLAAPGELSSLGAFHVGERVTQFAKGSLVPKFVGENAPGRPKLVFATSTGAIGVIADVRDTATAGLLSSVERNMRRVVQGWGNLDQLSYRTFKKDKRDQAPAGFIDGDFVESLVELDAEKLGQVMEGGSAAERIGVGRDEVVRLVEEMARLH